MSKRDYRVFDNMIEGVQVINEKWQYIYMNHAIVEQSKNTREELLGKTMMEKYPGIENTEMFTHLTKCMKERVPCKMVNEFFFPDGSRGWFDLRMAPIDDAVLILSFDITKEKRQEEELVYLNEALEEKVKERTKELNKTVEHLHIEIKQRKIAEENIKESLAIKEILLKEVTHRVKNSLQIISSLINLQKSSIENKQSIDLLSQVSHRIQSMALIHETLYKSSEFEKVKFKDYIGSLISYIGKTFYTPNIQFKMNIENLILSLDTATNCGMIVMELITNSIKYAFSEKEEGEISVNLNYLDNERYMLSIGDNGIGYPSENDFHSTKTLGMQIVISLTHQLDGEIKLIHGKGTTFEITFPIK